MFLRKILAFTLIALFTLSILVYGFYKVQNLILGPNLEISYPAQNEILTGTTTSIRGTVYRGSQLYINSIPIAFSDKGLFETRIAIYPPNTIILAEVMDKFGRKYLKTLNISSSLK